MGRRLALLLPVASELAGLVARAGGDRVVGSLAVGWRLIRRLLVAKELAGRVEFRSLDCGWREERRLFWERALIEDWVVRLRGRIDGED